MSTRARWVVVSLSVMLATAIVVPVAVAIVDARRTNSNGPLPAPCPAPTAPVSISSAPPGTVGARTGFSPGAGIFKDGDAELRREMGAMAAAGGRWIRLDLDWSWIGRFQERFDWCDADRALVAARAAGLEVVGLATYTPAWARPAGTTDKHGPLDPAQYAAFVEAAVARYRPIGVRVFELWNEPNIADFWQPRVDPVAYTRLLMAGSAAARRAAADVVVLAAGTAPASDSGGGQSLSPVSFLEGIYAAGGGPSFDAAATHPYTFPAAPLAKGTPFARLEELRAVMVAHGDGAKRLWLTEIGTPTGEADRAVSETDQAEAVTTVLQHAPTLPWVGPVFWYSYRDAGNDPDDIGQHFGIVRRDFVPKQGLVAFRKATTLPDPNPDAANP